MPEPKKKAQSAGEGSAERLWKSVEGLGAHSRKHLSDRYGLSESFQTTVLDQDGALDLCDRAMESLSSRYVDHMEKFKACIQPLETLHHLEEAEAIWQAESTIIKNLDAGGDEVAFLQKMREFAFSVLEDRLDIAAAICHRNANPENIAVCIGILGTMDRMLAEFGHPVQSEQRQKLREIIADFQ